MGKTEKYDYSKEEKFKEKFKIVNSLDGIRWKCNGEKHKEENLINCSCKEGLSDDEILLTHWLCYITNRQMDYRVIWERGGAVFSDAVKKYTKHKDMNCFYPSTGTFFRKNGDEGYVFSSLKTYGEMSDTCKERLKKYYRDDNLTDENHITFKSRFYTTDYLSILYTLYTLANDEYGYSFVKYISMAIDAVDKIEVEVNKTEYYVKSIAYALYRLSYNFKDGKNCKYFECIKKQNNNKNGDNKNSEDKKTNEQSVIDFVSNKFEELAKIRCDKIKETFNNAKEFKDILDKFYKTEACYDSMKRVWCALRDYLKDEQFKKMFKGCLESSNKREAVKFLFTEDNAACKYIELPGDVWNENTRFRQCLTEEHNGKLGKLLREVYENEKIETGYPEQFDVSFDFVPRMCENNNCDICLFANLNETTKKKYNKEKALALCVNDSEKYCPLMILYCGYLYKCNGEKCLMRECLQKDDV